jgi:CheY-like chemotaxis protein
MFGWRIGVFPSVADAPQAESALPTILVVEDDILVRLMIAEELRNAGFSVIEAANADEALTILQSITLVDLVVTDVAMPGSMDGLALATALRSTKPQVKIIVVSAQTQPAAKPDLADEFFDKPYDPARVVARVKDLLSARPE